ncbi:WD40 repeat-like protein [Haematococcus lacustris]|uniref:WD40 repeat-like protein n=1 Tax=Haematococcus lacustris TaxID=44745 RepID=A0A6A0AAL8_HAELA|nr:WD40 repeat-like protein [Haematococcus lacustris]
MEEEQQYLTPFKGEWDPKDLTESRVVIGRYISDDYDGVALHPVDIIDITSGALLAALVDHNLTTISPVNKPHPRRDVIVSGSSSFDAEPETKGKKGAGAASKTKAKPSGSTAKRKKPPGEDDEDEDD